jgi:hypothetical protein
LHGPPKFTQIGIFGLKTNHLSTLICVLLFCTIQNYVLIMKRNGWATFWPIFFTKLIWGQLKHPLTPDGDGEGDARR